MTTDKETIEDWIYKSPFTYDWPVDALEHQAENLGQQLISLIELAHTLQYLGANTTITITITPKAAP